MTLDKDRIVLSLLTSRSERVWRGEGRPLSPIPCLSDLMVHRVNTLPISHKKKSRQDFIHVPESYTYLPRSLARGIIIQERTEPRSLHLSKVRYLII
jgi:hypothetical protein